MLGFSPMMSETCFTAADHVELIQYALSVFNKSLANVVAIIGNNAEVNKSTANLCGIPLIECASHKFQLAVSRYLDRNECLLNKINTLMGKLKSLKLAGKLREHTPLQSIQRNKTRWSSTYDMINRYIELKAFFDFFQEESNFIDNLLTPRKNNDLQTLQDDLKNLFSVTCALQKENLDFYDVRVLFNEILAVYPYEEFQRYLPSLATIVHCPNFDNGVIKILQHTEAELSPKEVSAVRMLKVQSIASQSQQSDFSEDTHNFASLCLKVSDFPRQLYVDCRFCYLHLTL